MAEAGQLQADCAQTVSLSCRHVQDLLKATRGGNLRTAD